MTKTPEIETLSSRIAYENRWTRVREDIVRRRDGSTGLYGVIEKAPFAIIIPLYADGAVHLVEQYRYPVGARFWELPQGAHEAAPETAPEDLARAELAEETGLAAETMIHVGAMFASYGHSDQVAHVFLARGLVEGAAAPDGEEQGLVARRFSWDAMVAMIRRGEIRDGATIAALGLAAIKGLLPAIAP